MIALADPLGCGSDNRCCWAAHCCVQDPEQRLSLAAVMRHPWLTADGALPPLAAPAPRRQQQQQQQQGRPVLDLDLDDERELQELQEEQEEEQRHRSQLLQAALRGLVSGGAGDLTLLSFGAGEVLMQQGQPGGECTGSRAGGRVENSRSGGDVCNYRGFPV